MNKSLIPQDDKKISFIFQGKTFNFDFAKTDLIKQVADAYILEGEAESFLANFKKLKEAVEAVDKITRNHLLETFQSNFQERTGSITSEKIILSISETGSKYYIDQANIDQVPKEMYKTKVTHSVETKEVEKFMKEKGNLPLGINKSQNRNLSVTIRERKNILLDLQDLVALEEKKEAENE